MTEELRIEMGQPMAEKMNYVLSILRLSDVNLDPQTCAALICVGTYVLENGFTVGTRKAGFRAKEVVEEFLDTIEIYTGRPLN